MLSNDGTCQTVNLEELGCLCVVVSAHWVRDYGRVHAEASVEVVYIEPAVRHSGCLREPRGRVYIAAGLVGVVGIPAREVALPRGNLAIVANEVAVSDEISARSQFSAAHEAQAIALAKSHDAVVEVVPTRQVTVSGVLGSEREVARARKAARK